MCLTTSSLRVGSCQTVTGSCQTVTGSCQTVTGSCQSLSNNFQFEVLEVVRQLALLSRHLCLIIQA